MRYTITSQQFDYFREEGHIQFQDLFTPEEAGSLKVLLDELNNETGRDLQRGNLPLQKAMQLSRLGQALSGLLDEQMLQLAFTQYYPCYKKVATLEEISSITEVCSCALINLSYDELPELDYLPAEVGDVGFYKETFPIDYTQLDLPFLLIAFAKKNARYKLQKNDPHTHTLKKLGYAFGDRINSDTHPTISK